MNSNSHFNADALIGKIVAERYEIIALIGMGGIGIVYKARHTLMDRVVALKLLRQDIVLDKRTHQRFQQEARAVGELNHPNIVSVFDFGITENEQAFLVMDFVEGIDFDTYIQEHERGSTTTMLPIFIQICKALAHAHKHGVIHRDLKPGNVIITNQKQGSPMAKLVDFGMAKLKEQEGRQQLALTKPGEIFGSPYYMSPEQCSAHSLDERSDIYSMGCLMYEALTGRPPFLGKNITELAKMHLTEAADSIGLIIEDPHFCPKMQAIITKALAKQPHDRYQNMEEMLSELQSLAQSSLGDTRQTNSRKAVRPLLKAQNQPLKYRQYVIVAFVLAALILVLAIFVGRNSVNVASSEFNERAWKALNDKASNLAADGNFTRAEVTYLSAIKAAESGGTIQRLSLATSLSDLGEVYYKEGKLDLAETVLRQAVDNIQNSKGENAEELAPVLLRLGKLYTEMGRLDEAEVLHKKAINIVEECFGNQHPQMAYALYQYAHLKHMQGNHAEARHYKIRADKIELHH